MDFTASWVGITAVVLFILAYIVVIAEERLGLRKSIPVMVAAGLIWALIGYQYVQMGSIHVVEESVNHFLIEFAQLFLFLLTAMTYVNTMSERNVFNALRAWLVSRGYGYKTVFWITGGMSFFLSPVLDNLTTALVMCAVVMSIGQNKPRFISVACINIVVAANAGGAFSPFGDITTLMVWQHGLIPFGTFFALFLPSVINYLVPAFLMSFAVESEKTLPTASDDTMKRGARVIVGLFGLTIVTAVSFHNYFGLPPFLGMMTGLGYLQLYGFYLGRSRLSAVANNGQHGKAGTVTPFDSFRAIARVEWDTLLFFFGVIMSVGGLSLIGYLAHVSDFLYGQFGPTAANIAVGTLSAIIDNIPVMVSVLEMNPTMDTQQWLLITLTAGVGGSLLSVGSAAGVALMGQARGHYTFFGHLRWTPAIAIGYGLSVWAHLLINARFVGIAPLP